MNAAALPQLFLLPVGRRVLVYAPLSGALGLLSRADWRRLEAGTAEGSDLERLRSWLRRPEKPPAAEAGELSPRFLGLVTTRGCSMACSYCDFAAGPADSEAMPEPIALAAVTAMAEVARRQRHDRLRLHLFGGEPFAAFELVRAVVGRARALGERLGVEPFFEATSSGFYPREVAAWIADNFHHVVLSLDGPPHVHDRFRRDRRGRPTCRQVEESARILDRGTVELSLRLCVTAATVAELPSSVVYLLERFRPASLCVEPVRAEGAAGTPAPPDPRAFVAAFAAAWEVCQAHDVRLRFSGADLDTVAASLCPVGRDGLIVHPDGTLSSCYLRREEWQRYGLDLAYGALDPESGLEVEAARLAALRLLVVDAMPRCVRCFCRWHCAGGCRVHLPDAAWCTIARALTLWQLLRALDEKDAAAGLVRDPRCRVERVLAPEELP